MNPKAIIFTGGGTTGHVTKNLILMEALKKEVPETSMHYLGIKTGKEAQLITPEIATFHPISSGKLRRYFSLQSIPDFIKFLHGIWQSLWIIRKIKPGFIFSSGGYVALPAIIGAYFNRIPIFTHETDSYPGLANRIMAKMATTIFLGYKSAQQYFFKKNTIFTGNPVSPKLFEGNREKVITKLQLDPQKPILLIMGGSQGARQINDCIYPNLQELQDWNIIHLTGKNNPKNPHHPHYHPFEYVTDEYADFLSSADLVITRAGGNSLAEIEALGKTTLMIPLPIPAAAGDHQRKNAEEMLKKHPEWQMLYGDEVTPEAILKAIENLKKHPNNPKSHSNLDNPVDIILRYLKKLLKAQK